MKYRLTRFALVVCVSVLSIVPFQVALAKTGDTYVREISYKLEQPFAGISTITSFAQYLQLVYAFAIGGMGMVAVLLIMFAGLRWLTAAGNEQAIGEAKEIMVSAVTGLAIGLTSYSLLIFINPSTLKLNFSVAQIDPTGNKDNLFELSKCTEQVFGTNTCSTDNGDQTCQDISCGQLGFYNGAYCRGQTCGSGEGGCYPSATDPENAEACTQTQCGQYVQKCKDTGYTAFKTTFSSMNGSSSQSEDEAMRDCICNYYNARAVDLDAYPDSILNSADELTDNVAKFTDLCTETATQDIWVTRLSDAGLGYNYSGAPATTQWNCGFSCNISTEQVSNVSAVSGGGMVTTSTTYSCTAQ